MLEDTFILIPTLHKDGRGYFYESFNEKEFKQKTGIDFHPVQENQSKSGHGVLRGIHFQEEPHAQAKLVRVLDGCVLDVAVDIRRDSPTFGKYVSVELSDKNKRQLFIPRGFLHGFSVLSETAVFAYKCDNLYCKESEFSVRFDDPDINVDWRVPADKIIVSEKDKLAKRLKDVFDHGR